MENDLTSLEVLGLAIRAEMDASDLYSRLAGCIKNEIARDRILQLAREEMKHRDLLEARYEQLARGTELALPESRLPADVIGTHHPAMTLREALTFAIDLEKSSRDMYLRAHDQASDLTGKQMFKFLADMEFQHQMELTHEYQMLLQYPRYFDETQEPWSPEVRLGTGGRTHVVEKA